MASNTSASRNPERRVYLNLGLIWVVGISLSAWILYYTDWFPVVGGLLGLGGLFSWLAFVSKILKDDRWKGIQDWFDGRILQRRRTSVCLVFLILAFAVLFCFLGSVEVKATGAVTDRIVYVGGERLEQGNRLSPGRLMRRLVWTSWLSQKTVAVKVDGFPVRRVRLNPFQKQTLTLPGSFAREVVLVVPSPELIDILRNAPKTLTVSGGEPEPWERTLENYRGESFWIGCGPRVDVPSDLRDQWKLTLNLPKQNYTLLRWLQPRAFDQPDLVLHPGQSLQISLTNADGSVYLAPPPVVVNRLERLDQFPQQEEIDVPQP